MLGLIRLSHVNKITYQTKPFKITIGIKLFEFNKGINLPNLFFAYE